MHYLLFILLCTDAFSINDLAMVSYQLLSSFSRIFVGTWNVAGRSPVGSLAVDLDEWLNLKEDADIYVLGYTTKNVTNVKNPFFREFNLERHGVKRKSVLMETSTPNKETKERKELILT